MAADFRVALEAAGRPVSVGARLYPADNRAPSWLVLAPGAGAGQDHPFLVAFGRGLASRGLPVVTFNFPYFELGRRAPDPAATLEACWMAVLAAVHERAPAGTRIFAGGKSMGGRIASQVAAQAGSHGSRSAQQPAGLVFLGYPLHPPGRPQQQRTAHWLRLRLPALFVQGSRDPFASSQELQSALALYAGETQVLIVEEGDHSFKVPRRTERSEEEVYAAVQDAVAAWVAAH